MELTDIIRDGISIAAVLGLLAGALHLLRKRGLVGISLKQHRVISIVERTGLTPHHSLHLVKTERRTFLIAAHPGGCTVIDSYDDGGSNVTAAAP